MLSTKKLKRRPKHFQNFTDLTVVQFDELLATLEPAYERLERERKFAKERKRSLGAGRKYHSAVSERLLLTLMYYRLYVSQMLLGYLFNLDDSSVSREIQTRMLPALLEVLPVPVQQELLLSDPQEKQRAKRIGSLEELLKKHPEFEDILIDATEQEVRKPKDKLARKQRYSGKRKKHTLKTQVLVSNRRILHLSKHVPGSVNDLTVLRASGVLKQLPNSPTVRVDRGYEGIDLELQVENPSYHGQ